MNLPHLKEAFIYTFLSFIFHTIILKLSRFVFSNLVCTQTYLKQKEEEKLDWDSRIMSSIHACISTIIAYYAIFTEPKILDDMFLFNTPLFTQVISYTCGYIFADMPIVIAQNDKMMFIHHAMGITGLSASTTSGLCAGTLIIFLTTEITTPFMNLRWFLSQSGMKDNYLYYANGLFATLLWFVFRILIIPLYFFKMLEQWDLYVQVGTFLFYQCFLYAAILSILNVLWFYKIMNGLISVLFAKKKKE